MSICQSCGKEFAQKNKYRESKTCSQECRYALSGRSNKQTQGAQYLDRECPQCGDTFDGKTTHCSRECSNKARAGDKHPAVVALKERGYPACEVCGEPTMHSQRTNCPQHRRGWQKRELAMCPCGQPAMNLRSKYCSEEHRKQWGRKPAVEMVTKTCLGCGEEFTRPWYFPGKMKYCSNKCAHREQKKTTEVGALVNSDHTLIFRSTWEMRFYCVCLRHNIDIRSYDGPDIETSEGTYRPDFVIEVLGYPQRIVEVKGYLRTESANKLQEARDDGHDIILVRRGDLENLEVYSREKVLMMLFSALSTNGPVPYPILPVSGIGSTT